MLSIWVFCAAFELIFGITNTIKHMTSLTHHYFSLSEKHQMVGSQLAWSLIMTNKALVIMNGVALSLAEHKKKLWQCLEECQQCAFPVGKHIVWPNAAEISTIQHSSVNEHVNLTYQTMYRGFEASERLFHIYHSCKVKKFHSTYRWAPQSWRPACVELI